MTDTDPPAVDLALHSYSCRLRLIHDPRYDVFAFLRDAADRGYTGVTISLSGPDNHLHPPHRHLGGDTPAHVDAVRDLLDRLDLTVELDTDTVEPTRLGAAVEIARRLDARVLRTFTHHRAGPDLLAATVRDLATTADRAAEAGVVLAVENHEEFTSGELRLLAETLDHPAVRLLFDYGNSLPVLEDPHDALTAMLPWVAAAHVKDVALLPAEHVPEGVPATIGVPLGRGCIDLAGLTRRLVAGGLNRLAVQNSWGYHVPLGTSRPVDTADPRLGHGALTYTRPPYDTHTVCVDPGAVLTPVELVEHEKQALDQATDVARRLVRR